MATGTELLHIHLHSFYRGGGGMNMFKWHLMLSVEIVVQKVWAAIFSDIFKLKAQLGLLHTWSRLCYIISAWTLSLAICSFQMVHH